MRALSLVALLCALSMTLVGCPSSSEGGSGEGASGARPQPEENPPPAHDRVEAPEPVEALPSPPPLPELPEGEAYELVTEDGVHLRGTLRRASRTAPLVLLVHQLGSDRSEWDYLIRHLSREVAISTLAIDMRGHGESTHGEGGRELSFNAFTPEEWRLTASDVRAVVASLGSHELAPRRIAAVGSSIGSSAVIAAAAEEPTILAVVALSPGRAYHGFDALTPASQLGDRSLFAIAARDEEPAMETAETMSRIASRGRAELVMGDAHGTAMFELNPALPARIDSFLREELGAPLAAENRE